ncbi:MAG: xylulokinase [Candidatus Bathyarchaeia archaeon]
MAQLVGIDLGTSSAKVLVIDEYGNLLAQASSGYPISTPASEWAEQNPEDWWSAVKEAVRKALRSRKVKPAQISAIGLSGQMHGTVLLGKKSEPLRPAIIWADRRSRSQCEEIYGTIGRKKVLEVTCNPVMPGFMAPSLLWVKENEPSIFKRVHRVLLPKDYVRFRLTGSYATDFSDASATLLFDVRRREWSRETISVLDFQPEFFPKAYESIDVVGEVSREGSRETSLPIGVEVVAGGGDSPVGAVGCGVVETGIVSSNIGSAGQIFTVLDELKFDPKLRIHTFCHAAPGKWYIQGAILAAGLALSWFIENLGLKELLKTSRVDPYSLLLKEAASVEPGSDGLIFVPYLLGERSPHMDPRARGVFFGLSLTHRRAHMVRAIMEGVVYALRDSLEIFKELGVTVDRIVARGGGAKSKLWRQIQADVFNLDVVTVRVREEAAFGAALLAGVGSGIYKDLREAVDTSVRVRDLVHPHPQRVKIYDRYYQDIYGSLYPVLKDYFKIL